ncbi:hypothetical protein pneo_cds_971 [Pandoravirus neocaledonia]|uniref:Uncharacterized protein n=1 Tax=Pandoravirus neocaledonia TaxID=2107708 RepID=A0A2U7UDN5_9VIRU|nr:hypothetical protein pneo_cds_971 [Pandoravirus neocaledonia]AVK76578.1 hypothetical protein pneo_cds_971 [Pandoravirus neocaledonia]
MAANTPVASATMIDALPDDVLYSIVDAYVDDRSLGACLLAWRRFHVLGPDRLLQRRYRLATPGALCAAGDIEGMNHYLHRHHCGAVEHPGACVCTVDRSRIVAYVQTAQVAGRARMVMHLMRAVEPIERFSLHQWSALAFTAALRGRDDPDLVWLCRPEHRPTEEWDDITVIHMCTRAIQSKHSADAVVGALDALEALGGFPVAVSRNVWFRLAAVPPTPPASISDLVRAVGAAVGGGVTTAIATAVRASIISGDWRMLRDLLGDKRLAGVFLAQGEREIGVYTTQSADDALWFHEHVHQHQVAKSRSRGLVCLARAVASDNRTDLFGTVEAHVAAMWPEHPARMQTTIWGSAYADACMAGHVASIGWTLGHQVEYVKEHDLFKRYAYDDPYGIPEYYRWRRPAVCGVRSPLVVHRDRRDLFDLLLDRRPRRGIPQRDIDARVDHMVDITVEHALSQGDLSTVRRVHLVEPRLTEATIKRVRDQDVAPYRSV